MRRQPVELTVLHEADLLLEVVRASGVILAGGHIVVLATRAVQANCSDRTTRQTTSVRGVGNPPRTTEVTRAAESAPVTARMPWGWCFRGGYACKPCHMETRQSAEARGRTSFLRVVKTVRGALAEVLVKFRALAGRCVLRSQQAGRSRKQEMARHDDEQVVGRGRVIRALWEAKQPRAACRGSVAALGSIVGWRLRPKPFEIDGASDPIRLCFRNPARFFGGDKPMTLAATPCTRPLVGA